MEVKIKIVTLGVLNTIDFREHDYILKKIKNHSNVSNSGYQYTYFNYNFLNENNEEVLLQNDYFISESGFEEFWNGNFSGATTNTQIKLKEKLSGKTELFIFEKQWGEATIKVFLSAINGCQIINEIKFKLEIRELNIKLEKLEKEKNDVNQKLNKVYDEVLDYVKKFKPNMFLVNKIKDISGPGFFGTFGAKLSALEKELDQLHDDLNSK